MSVSAAGTGLIVVPMAAPENEARHRLLVRFLYGLAIAINLALFGFGFDYYTAAAINRPHLPKHHLLKPSGPIGLAMGFFGVFLFLCLFLYPLRKHWTWLSRQGNSRHWLDIHIVMGLAAPFIVAFHCTLKFGGIAGVAFWLMFAVSLSGVVGRYIYVQIPRSLNAAELTKKELEDMRSEFERQLANQRLLPEEELRSLLSLPDAERIRQLPLLTALGYMILIDLGRITRVSRLRRHAVSRYEHIATLGGFLRTRHTDLERAISAARDEAKLSQRILFLSCSHRVFHLWHVIHKPFSYTFAALSVLHITLQFLLGYYY